jgi:hypothetical protein
LPEITERRVRGEIALEIDTAWKTDVDMKIIAARSVGTLTGEVVGIVR